jgi:hypothetical protein
MGRLKRRLWNVLFRAGRHGGRTSAPLSSNGDCVFADAFLVPANAYAGPIGRCQMAVRRLHRLSEYRSCPVDPLQPVRPVGVTRSKWAEISGYR